MSLELRSRGLCGPDRTCGPHAEELGVRSGARELAHRERLDTAVSGACVWPGINQENVSPSLCVKGADRFCGPRVTVRTPLDSVTLTSPT